MMSEEIHSVESIWSADHFNLRHRWILEWKWDCCPFLHRISGLFHCHIGKINELYLPFFSVLLCTYNILIYIPLFVLCKAYPHPFISLICFVNGFSEYIPIQICANCQACANIQYCRIRTKWQIIQMKFLRYRQWVYRISFSCFHHSMIPPINESIAPS